MVPYLKPVAITAVLTGIGIAVVGTIIYSRMDSDPVECPAGLFFNKKPPDDLVAKLYVSVDESWFQLNVQPRFMWGWGGSVLGYCGAASLQSAALYYGTWISQEYPRRVAGNDSSPAFLSAAAHSFRLTVEEFDTSAYAYPQADHFLQWTQRHLYRGHVVIGTLYAYVHQIYTDPEFDHLVPIVGLTMTNESLRQYGDYDSWESEGFNYTNATNSSGFNNETNNNNTNVYTTNSLITTKVSTNITSVLYNDLSQPEVNEIDHPVAVDRVDYIVPKNKSVPFPFEYAFPDDTNFGLAVIGVMDTFGETYRTKLTPWSWTEPDWGREDGCNEIPALLNISIAVYGLTPGRVYSILRFDGNTSIPTSNFLGSRSYTKRWDFVARSSTYVQSPLDTIMTNTVMSYRTVLSDTQNVNSIFTTSAAAAAAAAAPLTAAPTRASVRGSLWLDGARAQLKPKEASPPSPQGHNHAAKRVDWGVPLVCIEVLVSVVATLAYVTRRRWRTASSMMDSYEAV